jgi:hypothetical protein
LRESQAEIARLIRQREEIGNQCNQKACSSEEALRIYREVALQRKLGRNAALRGLPASCKTGRPFGRAGPRWWPAARAGV